MIALIVLSQLAVLFPARRAARVPPAVATRTV
jgi:ABC-type lipoprotein release transport system permease subunit